MYVTCLYDIYNKADKMEEYIKLFSPIAESGLQIHLYTSPELAHHFKNYPKNVHIFEIPLSFFELYSLGINSTCNLPSQRTEHKDTREYLSLMNNKIEFMLRSTEICEDENIIWIDFAILKLFKNTTQALEHFKKYSTLHFDKLTMPGCWSYGYVLFPNSVHWRFCGSMFICPRKYIQRFYNDSKESLLHFMTTENIIMWEVNIWCHVETIKAKEYIQWYYALHDDTMVDNLYTIFNS